MNIAEEIRLLLPKDYRYILDNLDKRLLSLQEIRIRVGSPFRMRIANVEYIIDGHIVTGADVEEIIRYLCEYSLFAYSEELKQGFFTVKGGHRVGVAGVVVLDTNQLIKHVRDIRFVNIRIAHEIIGISDLLVRKLVEKNRLLNTLIIAPPCCGKTTYLRDIIRNLSDGFEQYSGDNVAVVDERCEIAGEYMGIPQNRIGSRTDVISACPKSIGIMMLLRAMAPGIIAVDEIGGKEDADALLRASYSGCRILASAHGVSPSETMKKENFITLEREHLFERYVVLEHKEREHFASRVYNADYEIC